MDAGAVFDVASFFLNGKRLMYVDTDRDGFVPDGKQFNYCHPSVLTGGCRKIFYVKVIPLELQEE